MNWTTVDIIQTTVIIGLCGWCAIMQLTLGTTTKTIEVINGILRRMVGS